MTTTHDVLVVGGGIGGVAAGIALAQSGRTVHLVEQASEFGEVGAGLQLGPNAIRSLDRLGAWAPLRDLAVTPRSAMIMHAVTGERLTRIDYGHAFLDRYGYPYVVAHRHDLHDVLVELARVQPRLTLEVNRRVTTVEEGPDFATVTFEDGDVFTAPLVIGADGIRSKVRELQDRSEPLFTGQVAYRGTVPMADADLGFDPSDMILWIGPNRHLVQYPVRGGELYNQVAVMESKWHAASREGWGGREELAEVFADSFETVQASLALFDNHEIWPIFDRDPLATWTTPHTVLIGDAAHAMRQYLAQGACQALEDVLVLTHSLATEPDQQAAFATYEQRRVAKAAKCQLVARPWGDLWHTEDQLLQVVRDRYFRARTDDDYSEFDWLYLDHVGHGVPKLAPTAG